MKLLIPALLIVLNLNSTSLLSQCASNTNAFKAGEKVVYEIYYNWGLIWVAAGEAVFTVEKSTFAGKSVFKLKGEGFTYPKYDILYKVRDKFESYVDTLDLRPYRYLRDTKEGSNIIYNDNYFSYSKKKVTGYYTHNKKPMKKDTLSFTSCLYDVLTMIYYSRTIDFSKSKPNDRLPIKMYLDNDIFDLSIKYIGKETLKTKQGNVNCIKFKPKLIPGTMFKEGDEMTVWVSDDKNKIPILIEAPIIIGQVKAILKSVTGTVVPMQ